MGYIMYISAIAIADKLDCSGLLTRFDRRQGVVDSLGGVVVDGKMGDVFDRGDFLLT